MQRYKNLMFVLVLVLLITIVPASAAVYASDNSYLVVIKYDNGVPSLSELFMRAATGKTLPGESEFEEAPSKIEPPPPEVYDVEKDLINVIAITKDEITYTKNIQTPIISNVYVSSRSEQDTDVMQTTNEPGYSVLEIYWEYVKDPDTPWVHYMRVNNLNDTQAVYSDFVTKTIWTKPITPARTAEIIASGIIPEWGTV